jgi:hypothetical protein
MSEKNFEGEIEITCSISYLQKLKLCGIFLDFNKLHFDIIFVEKYGFSFLMKMEFSEFSDLRKIGISLKSPIEMKFIIDIKKLDEEENFMVKNFIH